MDKIIEAYLQQLAEKLKVEVVSGEAVRENIQ